MRTSYGIALIATVALAKKGKQEEADDFVSFAVKNGKDYKNLESFLGCKKIFTKNHQKVKQLNLKHKGKSVKFADNFTSDMTDEEFGHYQGLNATDADEGASLLNDIVDAEGRNLSTEDDIDWVAAGKMRKVADQGRCRSAWVFAAATAQEGVQAIENDDGQPCARISEQQVIDCTTGNCRHGGCTGNCRHGGWYHMAWEYWRDGAMSEADYPYTGIDHRDCFTDPNATTVSTTETWYRVFPGFDAMGDFRTTTALKDGPMAVSIGGYNDCFRFYREGVLSDETCPTDLDHAVTLVGFTAAVTSEGTEGETTCVTTPRKCKNAWKKEIANNKCWNKRGGAAPWTNKRGRAKCCIEATEECTTTEPTEGGVTTPAFWTIQNSWGSNWGNKGFMNIEVTAGVGILGINQYMSAVTVR